MNLSSIIRRPALCRETSAPDNSLATSILPVPRSDSRGHLICCLARARQSSAQQSSHGETPLFQTPVVRQDVDGRSAPGAAGALSPLVAGKRFVCTECGKCCQGVGEVWANQSEITAIARHLGLSERHFKRKFTKSYSRRPGWFMLQRQQGSGDCVFLKEGTRCTIYGARPLQVGAISSDVMAKLGRFHQLFRVARVKRCRTCIFVFQN
jgi:AraC-like DNA-binding protein